LPASWCAFLLFSNYTNSGNVACGVSTSGVNVKIGYTATSTLPLNTWTHVACTYSAGTYKIYINGVSKAVSTASSGAAVTTAPFSTDSAVRIGSAVTISGAVRHFHGSLDEIATWSVALTPEEVLKIYARQTSPYSGVFTSRVMDGLTTAQSWTSLGWSTTLPFSKELPDYAGGIQNESTTDYSSLSSNTLMNNIMALWHFNEAAGTTTVTDTANAAGSAHNGWTSGITFGTGGQFKTAATFNGTSSFMVINDTTLHSNILSVSVWVKARTAGANTAVIGQYDTAGERAWMIADRNGDGKFGVYISNNGGNTSMKLYVSSFTMFDSAWHHVAFTFNTGVLRLYVDGIEDTAPTKTMDDAITTIHHSTAYYPVIGAYGSGGNPTGFLDGSVDEAAIWSRTLTPIEIQQLYQRGASRLKFQVKSCSASDCSDNTAWKGPDGTSSSYFSEEFNMSTQSTSPSGTVNASAANMTLQNYTSPVSTDRYFQFRTIFESDSSTPSRMPELKSVTVGPNHYDTSAPTVISKAGVSYTALSNFIETLGSGVCGSGILYNLGVGASYGAATWYYWNSTAWTAVTVPGVGQANSAATLATNASTFGTQVGTGTIYFKAFLQSSGSSKCELDNLALNGTQ